MATLQNKIQLFNKPNVNTGEEMKSQMKKAKFLSKLSKFENIEKSSEEKPSKAEVAKKTKMFESGPKPDVDEEMEKEIRKQSFQIIKQQFEAEKEEKENSLESDSSGFGSIEDISSKGSETNEPAPSIQEQEHPIEDLVEKTSEVTLTNEDD